MQLIRKLFIVAALFLCCASDFSLNAEPLGAPAAPKPPEVEVMEMSLVRKAGLVEVDTTVKNIGAKPIPGLTAVYRFFAIHNVPVTTQRTKVDEEVLRPGEQAVISAKLEEPARAITVEFSAVDASGRELRVKNFGPFQIE